VLAEELDALSESASGESRLQFTRPKGGMFLWVRLPPAVRASELFSIALERGVAFVPAPAFYAESGPDDAIRLNFSYPDSATLREGARRLGQALAKLRERNGLAA
jgi:2-aminoadipate transaminase